MVEDKALDDKDTLEKHGIKDGDRLYFKDLGPQVGYRTVSDICRSIHSSGMSNLRALVYMALSPPDRTNQPFEQVASLMRIFYNVHFSLATWYDPILPYKLFPKNSGFIFNLLFVIFMHFILNLLTIQFCIACCIHMYLHTCVCVCRCS